MAHPRSWLCIAVAVMALSVTTEAYAQDAAAVDSRETRPTSSTTATDPPTCSYAYQTLIADGASIGIVLLGAAIPTRNEDVPVGMVIAGTSGYVLATPIIHFAHKNRVVGGVGVLLRAIVATASIYLIGQAYPMGEYDDPSIRPSTAIMLATLWLATPIIVDAAMAQETSPSPKRTGLSSLAIAPTCDAKTSAVGLQLLGSM